MRERPLSILPIAILHFVFGGLGIFCGICSGVSLVSGSQNWTFTSSTDPSSANMKRIHDELLSTMESGPAYHAVQIGIVVVDLAISVTMIVSGIGLLQLRPWGRLLSILYALSSIALKIFAGVYALVFTIPALNEYLSTHTATAPEEQFAFTIMRMAAIVPLIIQSVGMIYPIVVLIIMFLPSVRAAFRGEHSIQDQGDTSRSFRTESDEI